MLTSSDTARVVSTPSSELRPGEMATMSAYLSDLFFVTLDTPEGSNVVPVDEAVFLFFSLGVGKPGSEGAKNEFPCDIHYLIKW